MCSFSISRSIKLRSNLSRYQGKETTFFPSLQSPGPASSMIRDVLSDSPWIGCHSTNSMKSVLGRDKLGGGGARFQRRKVIAMETSLQTVCVLVNIEQLTYRRKSKPSHL